MVVIHCTVAVSTPNSLINCGNSTVITVSVRIPMKASEPTATMAPMSLPLILSSSEFGAECGALLPCVAFSALSSFTGSVVPLACMFRPMLRSIVDSTPL